MINQEYAERQRQERKKDSYRIKVEKPIYVTELIKRFDLGFTDARSVATADYSMFKDFGYHKNIETVEDVNELWDWLIEAGKDEPVKTLNICPETSTQICPIDEISPGICANCTLDKGVIKR